jgi:hypothetical protein
MNVHVQVQVKQEGNFQRMDKFVCNMSIKLRTALTG